MPYHKQVDALRRPVDVVVGTPGRVIDLINKGILDLSEVKFAVLDEADEMLSFGFQQSRLALCIVALSSDHDETFTHELQLPRSKD